jgi:hypothetical protein
MLRVYLKSFINSLIILIDLVLACLVNAVNI